MNRRMIKVSIFFSALLLMVLPLFTGSGAMAAEKRASETQVITITV